MIRLAWLPAVLGIVLSPATPAQTPKSAFPTREFGETATKSQIQAGASPATQLAVRNGLLWLARHQEQDGSWSDRSCRNHCPNDRPCQAETRPGDDAFPAPSRLDVGLTGLALLAFLGSGSGPGSTRTLVDDHAGKQYEIGKDVIRKGLEWLTARQRKDGGFDGSDTYGEALAATALAEAYGMTRDDKWKGPAQRTIDCLCSAQKLEPQGRGKWGWRYGSVADVVKQKPDYASQQEYLRDLSDSDVSVTTWVAMAFKSARLSGLAVPAEACDGAVAYVKSATAENGLVGYTTVETAGKPVPTEHGTEFSHPLATMAACAICTRVFLEPNVTPQTFNASVDQIMKSLPSTGVSPVDHRLSLRDYYYWYYGSMAIDLLDGPGNPKASHKNWQKWNRAMQDAVLASQSTAPKQCSSGGFLQPDTWSYGAGPVYSTAINVLTLEVYYRYENPFAAVKKTTH